MRSMGRKPPQSKAPKYDLPGRVLLLKWRNGRPQHEVAHEIGIDPARYCSFETGSARPGIDWAFRIEEVTRGKVPADSWAKEPGVLAS